MCVCERARGQIPQVGTRSAEARGGVPAPCELQAETNATFEWGLGAACSVQREAMPQMQAAAPLLHFCCAQTGGM